MDDFLTLVNWLWSLAGVKFLTSHVAINVVVAVAAALQAGDFQLGKLAEFLWRKLLPLVLVYGAVKAVGIDAGLDFLAPIVFGLIELALLSDLTDNLARLGIPLPERVVSVLGKKTISAGEGD